MIFLQKISRPLGAWEEVQDVAYLGFQVIGKEREREGSARPGSGLQDLLQICGI